MQLGICYVAPDVHIPHYRGASTHVMELAQAFSRIGDKVHIICRRSPHQKSNEISSGVTMHRLYRGLLGPFTRVESLPKANNDSEGIASIGYSTYLRSAFAFFAGLKSAQVLRGNALDIILERETAFGAGALASKITRRPLILELIGPKYSEISMNTSRWVLAYSEKMVPESARGKTVYVKGAVNTNLFRPDRMAREQIRKALGIDDDRIVVGYVGTFQSWHGIDDIFKAAEHFRENSDVIFMLVGPKMNEGLAPDLKNIMMIGAVPYHEVYKYINAFDIALAPYNLKKSSAERRQKGMGSPLKVLEYMACGKPCIASSIKQILDIIEDEKTGIIYPEGDVYSLIFKIEELIKDERKRRRLGNEALKAAQDYTWEKLAMLIHSLAEECLYDSVKVKN